MAAFDFSPAQAAASTSAASPAGPCFSLMACSAKAPNCSAAAQNSKEQRLHLCTFLAANTFLSSSMSVSGCGRLSPLPFMTSFLVVTLPRAGSMLIMIGGGVGSSMLSGWRAILWLLGDNHRFAYTFTPSFKKPAGNVGSATYRR